MTLAVALVVPVSCWSAVRLTVFCTVAPLAGVWTTSVTTSCQTGCWPMVMVTPDPPSGLWYSRSENVQLTVLVAWEKLQLPCGE